MVCAIWFAKLVCVCVSLCVCVCVHESAHIYKSICVLCIESSGAEQRRGGHIVPI